MTMDNGMDVSPSWEELREERDALAEERQGMRKVIATLGAENREIRREADALAAHVEQLRGYLVGYSQLLRERAATFEGYSEAAITLRSNHYREAHAVDTAYKAAAEASLTKLKANWQAKALQDLFNQHAGQGMIRRGLLLDKAIELQEDAELRHRAQETTND